MTVLERINTILHSDIDITGESPATVEKMICMAYYIGRESAAKEVSDMYANHIAEQKKRAQACRYHHMAESVIGPENHLYCSDYAQDMTATFGSDKADI